MGNAAGLQVEVDRAGSPGAAARGGSFRGAYGGARKSALLQAELVRQLKNCFLMALAQVKRSGQSLRSGSHENET